MATHAQVEKNLNDIDSAWGQLQWLIDKQLPYAAKQYDNQTAIVYRAKRRW